MSGLKLYASVMKPSQITPDDGVVSFTITADLPLETSLEQYATRCYDALGFVVTSAASRQINERLRSITFTLAAMAAVMTLQIFRRFVTSATPTRARETTLTSALFAKL